MERGACPTGVLTKSSPWFSGVGGGGRQSTIWEGHASLAPETPLSFSGLPGVITPLMSKALPVPYTLTQPWTQNFPSICPSPAETTLDYLARFYREAWEC